MEQVAYYAAIVAAFGVLAVLMWGLGTFGRGGEYNRKNANKIMRIRVGAQAVAILLILLVIYLKRGG